MKTKVNKIRVFIFCFVFNNTDLNKYKPRKKKKNITEDS